MIPLQRPARCGAIDRDKLRSTREMWKKNAGSKHPVVDRQLDVRILKEIAEG